MLVRELKKLLEEIPNEYELIISIDDYFTDIDITVEEDYQSDTVTIHANT